MKTRYLSLAAAGLLCTTGCGLGELSDGFAPLITITSPIEAEVSLVVNFSANVIDETGVESVTFLVDGAVLATDSEEPYTTQWDTEDVTDGNHLLQVRARDLSGNQSSVSKSVLVNNSKN